MSATVAVHQLPMNIFKPTRFRTSRVHRTKQSEGNAMPFKPARPAGRRDASLLNPENTHPTPSQTTDRSRNTSPK